MTRAIYPGTFDPVHAGHLDIAQRASKLFTELIFAINDSPKKTTLFSLEERMNLAQRALIHLGNVSVITYSGLTVDCARAANAQVIVRGLRNLADFQFEHQLGLANHHLVSDIETCCLFCDNKHAYLSSTILKEVASLNGDYSEWAPQHVQDALRAKYNALHAAKIANDSASTVSRRTRKSP